MHGRLLLALLLTTSALALPHADAAIIRCDDPPARVDEGPGPHLPPPPVQILTPFRCPGDAVPPPPEPGEAPPHYAKRLIDYYVCTDATRLPPAVEVSDQCGPTMTQLGLP